MGIQPGKLSARTEHICASGTVGIRYAYAFIAAGLADVVVVLGVEKLNLPNVGEAILNMGTEEVTVNSMSTLSAGDMVELFSSGGGGFGNPKQRAIEKVAQDVKDGLVSIESARQDYGVAMDPEDLVVDQARTALLRSGSVEG